MAVSVTGPRAVIELGGSLTPGKHLCDIPNNDIGAFLSVEFFILALIDIISYLFIILYNKMMPSCHCLLMIFCYFFFLTPD